MHSKNLGVALRMSETPQQHIGNASDNVQKTSEVVKKASAHANKTSECAIEAPSGRWKG